MAGHSIERKMMRIARGLTVLFAVLSALQGFSCGSGDTAHSTGLRVIDTGSEPRHLLRYDFSAMSPQTMVMDMTMGMDYGAGSQMLPTIRMRMLTTGLEDRGDGTLGVEIALDGFDVIGGPETDPFVQDMMKNAIEELDDFAVSYVIDELGRVLSASYRYESSDPAIEQQLASLENQMDQLVVPFPEDPVGAGAVWTQSSEVDMTGISVLQTTTFELIEIDEARAVLQVTLVQEAQAQKFREQETGIEIELDYLSSEGSGRSTVHFGSLVPEYSLDMETEMSMSFGQYGGGQTVSMGMTMLIEIRPE